jgi:hypothetical protein
MSLLIIIIVLLLLAGGGGYYGYRRVYAHSVRPYRHGISFGSVVVLIILVLVLAWAAFLVSTHGWEWTREEMRSALQGAAYAAKDTSLDAALTTKVNAALALSKGIPASQIDVSSHDGVVTLRGDVPSEDVRTRAEAVAQDVPDARQVQNHLFVTSRSQ